jgi:transposase
VRVVTDATPAAPAATPGSAGRMEIVLVSGERIIVGADVDAMALARIIKALTRR